MDRGHRQADARLRFDWGPYGAGAIAGDADVAIVVDVLSFTTSLSVALDAGTTVLPYRWRDETAAGYAREHDAVLAVERRQARVGEISLSPYTIRAASPVERLVLPSPNGSTLAHQLSSTGAAVFGASIRNARSVAGWIAAHYDVRRTTIAVAAAGEHWPDGSLRPAVEDLWGAGAVIAGFVDAGWTDTAPEALAARAAYAAAAGDIRAALRACASGRELIAAGFAQDVDIAAEAHSSGAVPTLVGGEFVPATDRVGFP